MSIDVTTDLQHTVEDAAAHLYVWALKDIPQDLRDALADARDRETSVSGKRVREIIHRNVEIADSQSNLVCQDTGIAVYYCRVGEHFPLHPARIYGALKEGTERATVEHPLREPILTYPVLHYQNGGLVIDEHGETTVEGLFACGEIAGGTHGRNRMMGNSLLECCVFGRRAGRAAAGKAKS